MPAVGLPRRPSASQPTAGPPRRLSAQFFAAGGNVEQLRKIEEDAREVFRAHRRMNPTPQTPEQVAYDETFVVGLAKQIATNVALILEQKAKPPEPPK